MYLDDLVEAGGRNAIQLYTVVYAKSVCPIGQDSVENVGDIDVGAVIADVVVGVVAGVVAGVAAVLEVEADPGNPTTAPEC